MPTGGARRYLADMATVTAADVVRVFPGIEDHVVLEVLASRPTLGDLEAASQMLADQDEALVDADPVRRARAAGLVDILATAGVGMPDDDPRRG